MEAITSLVAGPATEKRVSFRIEGVSYPDPNLPLSCEEGWIPMKLEGEGVGDHVGPFVWESMHCSNIMTWKSGLGTIRIASGDEIHMKYEGQITDQQTGTWTEIEEIVGGTGRFENARGETRTLGVAYVVFDANQNPVFPMKWTAETEGWISFDA